MDSLSSVVDLNFVSMVSAAFFMLIILFYYSQITIKFEGLVGRQMKIFGLGLSLLMSINLYLFALSYFNIRLNNQTITLFFTIFNFLTSIIIATISLIIIRKAYLNLQIFGGIVRKSINFGLVAIFLLISSLILYLISSSFLTGDLSLMIISLILKLVRALFFELGILIVLISLKVVYDEIN